MIGQLRGILIEKTPPTLMLDVGGVGYSCQAPLSTFFNLPELGKEVTLRTHLIVREDAHLLYAFSNQNECKLFQEIIKVSGVGPKIALAILSGMSPEQFTQAVTMQDVSRLRGLPGIGGKIAERIIVDMKDKLTKLKLASFSHIELTNSSFFDDSAQEQAISALVALGYKPQEAVKAVSKIDASQSCEQIIREALQGLSKI
jgi:Holliday junction DNA helicase RuvA